MPAALAAVLVLLNTGLLGTVLLAVALLKALLPARWRRRPDRWLLAIAERWISHNSALITAFTHTRFEVEGLAGLRPDGHYLVLANHRSWVDIPVLQKVFNRRIPLLRFFLKHTLFWVPVLGLCWWALDFPFMRRYTRKQLAQRPALAGRDLEATRRACARFRGIPVAVMNFVEGTRFTPAKQSAGGGYRHLLRPKAGGVDFILGAMGDTLDAVLDVSLAYDPPTPTLVDLFADRVRLVRVHVVVRPLPDRGGDRTEGRARTEAWVNALWREKDARLDAMARAAAGRAAARG